jgi:hypothetical protein
VQPHACVRIVVWKQVEPCRIVGSGAGISICQSNDQPIALCGTGIAADEPTN